MAATVLTYEQDCRVMVIQSLKSEKIQEEDGLAIFKPGLW